MGFSTDIVERAKAKKGSVLLLPESTDERMLEASKIIIQEGIAERVILFGETDHIRKCMKEHSISSDDIHIVDPNTDERKEQFIQALVEKRKHKGVDEAQARTLLQDPLWYATMMIAKKEATALVAGAVNSTSNVLRAAISLVGTAPNTSIVSSCFLMESPDNSIGGHEGQFIFSDCGIVPRPSVEELAEITISAAQSCKSLLQVEPIIAMTSFSSKGSAKHEEITKIQEALAIVKKRAPHLIVDGELQVDAALSPRVGASKAPDSPSAGKANTLIFPDLNSGNIAYKTAQFFGKMNAYGPLIQGLDAPINDLSRGCITQEIVIAAAITICQGA